MLSKKLGTARRLRRTLRLAPPLQGATGSSSRDLGPGPGPVPSPGLARAGASPWSRHHHSPKSPARSPGIGAETQAPDPGQIGFRCSLFPPSRPHRESRFPDSRPNRESDPVRIRCFLQRRPRTALAVTAHCHRQATASTIRLRRPRAWVGKEAHRPIIQSRQRLQAPVEAHTT